MPYRETHGDFLSRFDDAARDGAGHERAQALSTEVE